MSVSATIRAFGAKSRFFHCEFFQLRADKPGLGRAGDYVALEVNMRPAGGYTPDIDQLCQQCRLLPRFGLT